MVAWPSRPNKGPDGNPGPREGSPEEGTDGPPRAVPCLSRAFVGHFLPYSSLIEPGRGPEPAMRRVIGTDRWKIVVKEREHMRQLRARWMVLGLVGLVAFGCTPEDEAAPPPPPPEDVPGIGFPGLDARVNGVSTYTPAGGRGSEQLVATGAFTLAGGDSAVGVAVWDGSSWSDLDYGLGTSPAFSGDPVANASIGWNGELYVGGFFDRIGRAELEVSNLASWDGSAWADVAMGTDGEVYCFTTYDDRLAVGGAFSAAGVTSTSRIALYDGALWTRLGEGVFGNTARVYDAIQWGDDLVVGGRFVNAGTVLARNIARWNGTAWAPFGAGFDGDVFALAVYQDVLYAGGIFSEAQGTWMNDDIDLPPSPGWVEVEMDPFEDRTHMVYYDTSTSDLVYAIEQEDGSWTTEIVDAAGDVGNYCDLFLDLRTEIVDEEEVTGLDIHVAYYDATNQNPKYAVRRHDGSGWEVETIEDVTATENGMYTSIVVNPDGEPVIAFQSLDPASGSPNGLRQALCYPAPEGSSFDWTTIIIDTGRRFNDDDVLIETLDVGAYAELDVGPTGRLHLVYRADADNELYYTTAARTRGAWGEPEQIASSTNGFFPNIVVDEFETPHVSYFQDRSTRERVWYITKNGSTWTSPDPISPRGGIGGRNDLRIDDEGNLHAVFYNMSTGRIGFSSRGPSEWEATTVDLAAGLGGHVKLVLHEGLEPRVLYTTGSGSFKKGIRAVAEPATRIARWNPTDEVWEGVENGLNWWARDFLVHEGELIVGGAFSQAGSVTANRVARWNGVSYLPLGSTFASPPELPRAHVWSITSFQGRVIASGNFTKVGGQTANYVVDLGL